MKNVGQRRIKRPDAFLEKAVLSPPGSCSYLPYLDVVAGLHLPLFEAVDLISRRRRALRVVDRVKVPSGSSVTKSATYFTPPGSGKAT